MSNTTPLPRRSSSRTPTTVTATVPVILVLLAACGAASTENQKVCQKAYDRYVKCMGEVGGPELQEMASSHEKDGRDACAKDQPTIDVYKRCLGASATSCDAFLDCIDPEMGGPQ